MLGRITWFQCAYLGDEENLVSGVAMGICFDQADFHEWVFSPPILIFYSVSNESNSGYSRVGMCYSWEMTKVSSGEDSWPFDKV